MSNISVNAHNLSKNFSVYKEENTVFRSLRSFLKGENIKHTHTVLKNISFRIDKGENVALIGKNGSGKTTLLRILSNIYSKDSGSFEVEGRINVLFKFWIGFNHDLSVIDNIYLYGVLQGISREVLSLRVEDILKTANLYDVRFSSLKELSGGQQQRLALTIFFLNSGDILMFDECTAVLDKEFSSRTDNYFKSVAGSEKIMIMTSHDGEFLKEYCQRAIWLDEGRIRKDGNIEEVLGEYERSVNE